MLVVTHDIATARRVADYIGMLYLRGLVKFGTKEEMFDSDMPVVRQFLAGATDGPIGMSEEADQGRHPQVKSSYGMTAEETESMEREAGAPDDRESDGNEKASGGDDGERKRVRGNGSRIWHREGRRAEAPRNANGEAEEAEEVPLDEMLEEGEG